MNFVRIHAIQQGGMLPENQKNIPTDKNIWASSITGIIVNSSTHCVFQLYGK
jgi:hypothetical protein